MRTCSRCILPESYQGISFDDHGVCNYCRSYAPYHEPKGKRALQAVVASRPAPGRFDCVVPISGGKDSTFILWYVVRELALRPLAVNYDAGFQTVLARENVRTSCATLSVPLLVVGPPSDTQAAVMREWVLLSESVGRIYGPCGGNCEAFLRTAAIAAARVNDVPFVMWGSSALESYDADSYVDYKSLGTRSLDRLTRVLEGPFERFMRLARDPSKIRKLPGLAREQLVPHVGYRAFRFDAASIRQRRGFGMPWRMAVRPRFVPPFTAEAPQFIHFFDYVEWDSVRNIETLERELGWRHPPGVDSRFDCAVHCLGNYDHLQRWGISHDGVNFCNFVREGKMSREEALERERALVESLAGERQDLLGRIGLPRRPR